MLIIGRFWRYLVTSQSKIISSYDGDFFNVLPVRITHGYALSRFPTTYDCIRSDFRMIKKQKVTCNPTCGKRWFFLIISHHSATNFRLKTGRCRVATCGWCKQAKKERAVRSSSMCFLCRSTRTIAPSVNCHDVILLHLACLLFFLPIDAAVLLTFVSLVRMLSVLVTNDYRLDSTQTPFFLCPSNTSCVPYSLPVNLSSGPLPL